MSEYEKNAYVYVEFTVAASGENDDEIAERAADLVEDKLKGWDIPDHYIQEVVVD